MREHPRKKSGKYSGRLTTASDHEKSVRLHADGGHARGRRWMSAGDFFDGAPAKWRKYPLRLEAVPPADAGWLAQLCASFLSKLISGGAYDVGRISRRFYERDGALFAGLVADTSRRRLDGGRRLLGGLRPPSEPRKLVARQFAVHFQVELTETVIDHETRRLCRALGPELQERRRGTTTGRS